MPPSSCAQTAVVDAAWLSMLWLLSAAKKLIMRHPMSALLVTMCAHSVCHYILSFSFAWPAVVQPAPTPRRFFPRSSPVIDFPYGDITGVMSLLGDGSEECIFVMYYAPWCGRSVVARTEFDKAARYLEDEVRFAAVNCWYENGSCRQQHGLTQFPVMYFYWVGMDGIKYNGILSSNFIVQFIFLMLNPIQRLSNIAELAKTVASSDSCVIGYFDMLTSRHFAEYKQFRFAALRAIERDPKNVVQFGVVTDRLLASRLGLKNSPSIIMTRSLSTSIKFPRELNFTSSFIVQWTFAYRQQPAVKWMLPSGLKSLSLSSELRRGPALIAFINADPLSLINFHYTVLRSIAMRYLNCNSTILDNIDAARLVIKQYRVLERRCRVVRDKEAAIHRSSVTRNCCLSVNSCETCINYHLVHPHSIRACDFLQMLPSDMPSVRRSCVELSNNYNTAEFYTNCCGFGSQNITTPTLPLSKADEEPYHSTLHQFINDQYVSDGGMKQLCKRLKFSASMIDDSWVQDIVHNVELSGLSCRTNSSVRFYAMDQSSSYGNAFLSNFVGDESFKEVSRDTATVVILKLADQTVYAMQESMTHRNLGNFLINYTKNDLPQFHRSTKLAPVSSLDSSLKDNKLHVVEVTAKFFDDIVMDPTKDVVLLYYTPWCGFCKVFSHIFLSLAQHFDLIDNLVFARINAATNDLPWHLKVDSYPTLIIFPAGDKANSVVFPRQTPLTLSNLALFIHRTASSSFEMRICRPACVRSNINIAANQLHRLTRRTRRMRQAIDLLRAQLGAQLNDLSSQFPESPHVVVPVASSTSRHAGHVVPDVSEPVTRHTDAEGASSLANSLQRSITDDENFTTDFSKASPSIREMDTNFDAVLHETDWRTTCNAGKILQLREDLTVLRRRLYRYQEQTALVRHVYRIMRTVSVNPVGRLRRRHWLEFQRHRTRFVLRLHNYKDYDSGSDIGTMMDFR